MSQPRVVILDYGSGNIHSAAKALQFAGAQLEITADRDAVLNCEGLVVPGVGAFDAVMTQLRGVAGDELIDRRLAGGRPVFGICVGLQIMFETGEEHGVISSGLGQWPGAVRKLSDAPRLPHIGWNTVDVAAGSHIFAGVERERFYFVHSYAAQEWILEPHAAIAPPQVSWSEYGNRFIAAVENGPLTATQFHPEKSGEAGLQLLSNWVKSLT